MVCVTPCISLLSLTVAINLVDVCFGAETCYNTVDDSITCDYGCCGDPPQRTCCPISTSVLVVACVVSGLVLISLIAAIIICCYKNYKDKQASRVRRLQEEFNQPLRVVSPPKPPAYIGAPPAYSEQMPESHFRPPTVSGHVPMRTRYRAGNTPMPRYNGVPTDSAIPGAVSVTLASARYPVSDHNGQIRESRRSRHITRNDVIPEHTEIEAPPPYREFERGQTPAHRHRRFIRTPSLVQAPEQDDNSGHSNTNNTNNVDTNIEVTRDMEINRTQTSVSVITQIREESRLENSESRLSDTRQVESRAETVARILRPSRIPTRIQETPVSQTRDRVTSRESTTATTRSQDVETQLNYSRINRNTSLIDDLSTI